MMAERDDDVACADADLTDATNGYEDIAKDSDIEKSQTPEQLGLINKRDENETCDSEIVLDVVAPPSAPDGGYGWIIVLGASLAHLIIGGTDRSDGILFLKFINRFQRSAQSTAWVSSLSTSCRLVLGPLTSAFCNRFSCRTAVITGGVISALGVLLSGFTTDLVQLYVTYGVISGIGRSLAYAPCLIITGTYFDKRRGLAVGIATAGVGLGTFLVPSAVEFLFEQYGYLGAFLILSGACLNFIVCGALFRPLSVHRNILALKRQKKNRILVTANKNNNQSNTTAINNINNSSIDNSTERVSYEIFPKGSTHSDDHIDTQHKIAKSDDGAISQDVDNALLENETIPDSKTKTKKMFIELSLLKEPPFIIYCISIMLYTASFKSGFIFLPALVKSSGISESDAALIVSIIGVFDFTGRIVTGFIFDFQRVKQHRTVIYSGIVFVIAILSFLCPLVSSFKGFACLGSVYGLLTGAYISQKSVIVVDILGVEKLTSSFGILICFQGFGSLLGPPLSGLMKDIYGQYDEAFYFCGGLMMFSSFVMLTANIWKINE